MKYDLQKKTEVFVWTIKLDEIGLLFGRQNF